MISAVVVIVHVIVNNGLDLQELSAGCHLLADVILHVAMKAFQRGIVPAVTLSGHGLAQLLILQDIDEALAGVMADLVGIMPNSG